MRPHGIEYRPEIAGERTPAGLTTDRDFDSAQFVAETEARHELWDRPGAVTVMYWLTCARLSTYQDAIALAEATR